MYHIEGKFGTIKVRTERQMKKQVKICRMRAEMFGSWDYSVFEVAEDGTKKLIEI